MSRARPAIALLVETSNRYGRELVHGVRDYVRQHGKWAIHLTEQGRGDKPPPWLATWQGDGILARIENTAIARAVRRTGCPVVNLSASGIAPEFPAVISDSRAVARLAADHLLACGLRNFAYCGDARFLWSATHGRNFAAALRAVKCSCTIYPAEAGDFADWQAEQRKLGKWLRGLPRPVGIMTCFDIRGQQVLDICRQLRLRVPDEVAVIGQHNDELLCDLCDPPLSSVIPNPRRAGYEAAELLDRLLRGRRVAPRVYPVSPLGVATRQSTELIAVDDERLARAMRYLKEHASEPISVEDIAREAGLSRTLLERKFRDAFGDSPWAYVLECRLHLARSLLTETTLGMAEIAERTGFVNAAYFSSAFRKLTGEPPGSCRRAARSPTGPASIKGDGGGARHEA